jgi:ubiquinone/menaquinone biosynthesis C-methylase UbiE
MSKIKDQRFLQKYQYKSAEKYSDRIQFHEHFSTNKYGWFLWVFDQLRIPSKCHILELGCGPGNLWKDNLSRLSEDWTMMLSDYSIGMVKQARSNLETHPLNFCFSVIDAQRIPFADKSFDAIIANHMLYHIPERHHALSEIHRVLKANGHFYASTVGQSHLSELSVLLKRFDPNQKFFWGESLSEDVFTLESGFAELSQWFHILNITRY